MSMATAAACTHVDCDAYACPCCAPYASTFMSTGTTILASTSESRSCNVNSTLAPRARIAQRTRTRTRRNINAARCWWLPLAAVATGLGAMILCTQVQVIKGQPCTQEPKRSEHAGSPEARTESKSFLGCFKIPPDFLADAAPEFASDEPRHRNIDTCAAGCTGKYSKLFGSALQYVQHNEKHLLPPGTRPTVCGICDSNTQCCTHAHQHIVSNIIAHTFMAQWSRLCSDGASPPRASRAALAAVD